MNLLKDCWVTAHPSDLKLLLNEHFGGHGQYDKTGPLKLYLPLGGPTCQIVLTLNSGGISRIEPGAAFDEAAWAQASERLERSLMVVSHKVGREFSFSRFRVLGAWRGPRSGFQILPPPAGVPRAPNEMADHPFVLEFPLEVSDNWPVTNQRRIRSHRKFTRLLNVLLAGGASIPPRQQEGVWAAILGEASGSEPEIKWVNRFFFANLGEIVVDELSLTDAPPITSMAPDKYYSSLGHDEGGLRVPSDLDESLSCYLSLSDPLTAKFDRAAFWFDMTSQLWHLSGSSSFGALVSAIEALTERGSIHKITCPHCGEQTQHEAPGATRRFQEFLDTYTPGASMKSQRDKFYKLRSKIFHGSSLMRLDQDCEYSWDPDDLSEQELHRELWSLVRTAIRNWLLQAPGGNGVR